jgi:beta-galactosidase
MKISTFNLLVCLLMGIYIPVFAQKEANLSLIGPWFFKTDPYNVGESEKWFDKSNNNAGWDQMQVPSNWDLRNEYAHYTGKAWYQKSFDSTR